MKPPLFECPRCTTNWFTLSEDATWAECNVCALEIDLATVKPDAYDCTLTDHEGNVLAEGHFPASADRGPAIDDDPEFARPLPPDAPTGASYYNDRPNPRWRYPGPCPCACNSGGQCGGCGHAGCGGR